MRWLGSGYGKGQDQDTQGQKPASSEATGEAGRSGMELVGRCDGGTGERAHRVGCKSPILKASGCQVSSALEVASDFGASQRRRPKRGWYWDREVMRSYMKENKRWTWIKKSKRINF